MKTILKKKYYITRIKYRNENQIIMGVYNGKNFLCKSLFPKFFFDTKEQAEDLMLNYNDEKTGFIYEIKECYL